MSEIDYTKCLAYLYPNVEWSLNNNNLDELVWNSNVPKPSQEALDAKWDEVNSFYQKKYADREKRKQEILDRLNLTQEEARLIIF